MSKAYAVIAGVGPGTGASIARKFAQTYPVVLLARNIANLDPIVNEIKSNGGQATGISTDLNSSQSVRAAFDQIKQQYEGSGSALAAAVFNPSGGFIRKPFLELTEQEFTGSFENQGYIPPPPLLLLMLLYPRLTTTEKQHSLSPKAPSPSFLTDEGRRHTRQPSSLLAQQPVLRDLHFSRPLQRASSR